MGKTLQSRLESETLYFSLSKEPQKHQEQRDSLLLWEQFAGDSLPRGGQPFTSSKNEPPYSFFAADLLVSRCDFVAVVVLQVGADFATGSTGEVRHSSPSKHRVADVPKSALCNASHEKLSTGKQKCALSVAYKLFHRNFRFIASAKSSPSPFLLPTHQLIYLGSESLA
jgi:hypothetical protein